MQTIKTPRPWKKLISLFAVAATLAGCASSQKYNARLNGELGKTSQQLISAFGQPSKVRKLANGDEIISYVSINYQVIPDPNYYFNTGFMTENELFDPFTYGVTKSPSEILWEKQLPILQNRFLSDKQCRNVMAMAGKCL